MSARSERGAFTAAARRIGANRAAGLAGLELVIANLEDINDAIGGQQMLDLVTYHTDQMHQDAQSRAAGIGSGRYRNAIRKKVFTNDDGYAGTVFALQLPWNRPGKGARLWPKNIPLWLEHGTSKMESRPHLIPALSAAIQRLNRAVERLLQAKASA